MSSVQRAFVNEFGHKRLLFVGGSKFRSDQLLRYAHRQFGHLCLELRHCGLSLNGNGLPCGVRFTGRLLFGFGLCVRNHFVDKLLAWRSAISDRALSASFSAFAMLSSRSFKAWRIGPQAILRSKKSTTKNAMVDQTTVPNAGVRSASMGLSEGDEQANNHTKEGNALYKCGCNNHVGANVTGNFRLARHGFQCGATNTTYTNTCTDSCSTCTEACEALSNFKKDGQQFHLENFESIKKNQ